MLYQASGTVWIAGRSEERATQCIDRMKATTDPSPSSSITGKVHFLHVALDDLTSIKPAIETFKRTESRLDVLSNNAGVSLTPAGNKSAQGFELMMATDCLGPYLFTELLYPPLQETATKSSQGSVHIVWNSSQYVELQRLKNGLDIRQLENPPANQNLNYVFSKLGNWYLASEFARRANADNRSTSRVVHNPDNLKTNLLRHTPCLLQFGVRPLSRPAKQGAYTGVFAGLSLEVTDKRNGVYIIPWGRFYPSLPDVLTKGLRGEDEGGPGQAAAFREWCEKNTSQFR